MNKSISLTEISKMIDHSLLHPTMTDEDIVKGCEISKKYKVANACIKPYSVQMVKELLADSDVGICPVIGFPHGNSSTSVKVKEAELAVMEGADEIDMVVNIGKVIGCDWDYVSQEIRLINEVVTLNKAILKVIFENDYLQDAHIVRLCDICSEHQVAFVKTSTGYGFVKQDNGMYSYKGATDHQLKLMRKQCSPLIQIKAAGGIRKLDDVLRVRELGVTRIGATATEEIINEAISKGIK